MIEGSNAEAVSARFQINDDDHLSALGYKSEFRREMGLWSNFALGFTYLSPVVGIYSLFAFGLISGGPPMIWAIVIAGIGQLLVALIFGEVVSQYPVAGGVYPWCRRLWGRKWAWMAAWVYMLALIVTIAAVTYGSGLFVAMLFETKVTANISIISALVLLGIVSAVNFAGTKVVAKVALIGFGAEIIGAVVVGVWLLATERHQSMGIFFERPSQLMDHIQGSYFAAFAAAGLIGTYLYYGFEACGDVAEEVSNPGRVIPRAMRMTIYVGGLASLLITLALILAIPDLNAVYVGAVDDPVSVVFRNAFGDVGFKIIVLVVLISFFSCALSLEAAASRLIFSYARDDMLVASSWLKKVSKQHNIPRNALVVAGVLPALIVLGSKVSEDALTKIISFAALGIYLTFMMVVIAALRARMRGWKPSGAFRLGKWGLIVNLAALAYQLIAVVDMAWPRSPEDVWYDNWIVLLSASVVVGTGLIYMFSRKPYLRREDIPTGDAT